MLNLSTLRGEIAKNTRNLWLLGLGAVATVEETVKGQFDGLVEKGQARKGNNAIEKSTEAATAKVKGLVTKVEDQVGKSVRRGLKLAGVPTREEIHNLTESVEKLTLKVDSVNKA